MSASCPWINEVLNKDSDLQWIVSSLLAFCCLLFLTLIASYDDNLSEYIIKFGFVVHDEGGQVDRVIPHLLPNR